MESVGVTITSVRVDFDVQTEGHPYIDTSDDERILAAEALPERQFKRSLEHFAVEQIIRYIPDDQTALQTDLILDLESSVCPQVCRQIVDQHRRLNSSREPAVTRAMIEQIASVAISQSANEDQSLAPIRLDASSPRIRAKPILSRGDSDPIELEALVIEDTLYLIQGQSLELRKYWVIHPFQEADIYDGWSFKLICSREFLGILTFKAVESLGYHWRNAVSRYIHPSDFSLVDVILSLPDLSEDHATSLLSFLVQNDYLVRYLRSKVSQFRYNENSPRDWPEMIGRFIQLLHPKWVSAMRIPLARPDFVRVVRSLPQLNAPALLVLQTVLDLHNRYIGDNNVFFLWKLLCKSLFMNDYLGNKRNCRPLNQIFNALMKKGESSRTYEITDEIIEELLTSDRTEIGPDRADVIAEIVSTHLPLFLHFVKVIPLTPVEAHALYFPLLLELSDAVAAELKIPEYEHLSKSKPVFPKQTASGTIGLSGSRGLVSFALPPIDSLPKSVRDALAGDDGLDERIPLEPDRAPTRRLSKLASTGCDGRPQVLESRLWFSSASSQDSLHGQDSGSGGKGRPKQGNAKKEDGMGSSGSAHRRSRHSGSDADRWNSGSEGGSGAGDRPQTQGDDGTENSSLEFSD
jgi:hypothetical protein